MSQMKRALSMITSRSTQPATGSWTCFRYLFGWMEIASAGRLAILLSKPAPHIIGACPTLHLADQSGPFHLNETAGAWSSSWLVMT